MCEVYTLDHIRDLRQIEEHCSHFYQKLGLSHNLSALVFDTHYNIYQCAAFIISKIEGKNIYFKIVKKYIALQHQRYGCSVKTFIALLGCFLHFIIDLLEEKLSRRYIIQGIQDGLEILAHLYRKSGKRIEDHTSFKMDKLFGYDTTDFLKNQITKIINISRSSIDEELDDHHYYSQYVQMNVHRLCHYESSEMKNMFWKIVEGVLFRNQGNERKLSKSSDPITNITALLSHTIVGSGQSDLNAILLKFKDEMQNIITMISTNTQPNEIDNFSIHSGLLVTVTTDVADILTKYTGLKNCLLFAGDIDCNIVEKQCNFEVVMYSTMLSSETVENNWQTDLITKIKLAQANCIILMGSCEGDLKNMLLFTLEIPVIENVSSKILDSISSTMDVNMIYDINSNFTPCQLMIDIISSTTCENSILASIQIPEWMKIFAVTTNNFKTIIIRHSSKVIAEALLESFNHNLRRIDNSLSMGYYLEGSGGLEVEFAAELKARAENQIINNNGIESVEIKSKVLLALTKGLELFHYHLKTNLSDIIVDSNHVAKLDDLESKIGCIELLSECLTQILSTDLIILNTELDNCIPK